MKNEESGQSAGLNAFHGDKDSSFGNGGGSVVIAHQSALAHQLTEGAVDHAVAGRYLEAGGGVGTFHRLHIQSGESLDPLSEVWAGVATNPPQDAQLVKPSHYPTSNHLSSVALRHAGITSNIAAVKFSSDSKPNENN